MDTQVLEQARRRIEEARGAGLAAARFDAALERSRQELEALSHTAAALESSLPEQIGVAVQEGLAREVIPVAKSLAEIRGLLNQTIRRLERIEQEVLAERAARLDDLALLVDLVSSGWKGVDARLARLEGAGGEVVPLRHDTTAAIA